MMKRFLCVTLFLSLSFALPGYSNQKGPPVEPEASTGRPVARFSSWVLFRGGRVVQGAPFLAYGYLSEIREIPQLHQSLSNESSAVLTFVIEGTALGMRRGEEALLIEGEGTLRVFFDPQGKRDFTEPRSFRTGKEVATYTLQRQVVFNPDGGWLYDRSFAQLTASQNFTVDKTEINLLRLWGTRLALRSQARAGDGLPSPVPGFSGAIPYLGQIFIDGERTEYDSPGPQGYKVGGVPESSSPGWERNEVRAIMNAFLLPSAQREEETVVGFAPPHPDPLPSRRGNLKPPPTARPPDFSVHE